MNGGPSEFNWLLALFQLIEANGICSFGRVTAEQLLLSVEVSNQPAIVDTVETRGGLCVEFCFSASRRGRIAS